MAGLKDVEIGFRSKIEVKNWWISIHFWCILMHFWLIPIHFVDVERLHQVISEIFIWINHQFCYFSFRILSLNWNNEYRCCRSNSVDQFETSSKRSAGLSFSLCFLCFSFVRSHFVNCACSYIEMLNKFWFNVCQCRNVNIQGRHERLNEPYCFNILYCSLIHKWDLLLFCVW